MSRVVEKEILSPAPKERPPNKPPETKDSKDPGVGTRRIKLSMKRQCWEGPNLGPVPPWISLPERKRIFCFLTERGSKTGNTTGKWAYGTQIMISRERKSKGRKRWKRINCWGWVWHFRLETVSFYAQDAKMKLSRIRLPYQKGLALGGLSKWSTGQKRRGLPKRIIS